MFHRNTFTNTQRTPHGLKIIVHLITGLWRTVRLAWRSVTRSAEIGRDIGSGRPRAPIVSAVVEHPLLSEPILVGVSSEHRERPDPAFAPSPSV